MAGFLPIIPCSHSIPGTLAFSSTNTHTHLIAEIYVYSIVCLFIYVILLLSDIMSANSQRSSYRIR
jgi:hypothetical protein